MIKQSHNTCMESQGARSYSSHSFSTSALDGGEWSASRSGRSLPPGKGPPVPIVQEAGWAPEPVWTQRLEEELSFLCQGSKPRSPGRPVRSQTLHWVTPVKKNNIFLYISPRVTSLSGGTRRTQSIGHPYHVIFRNKATDHNIGDGHGGPDGRSISWSGLSNLCVLCNTWCSHWVFITLRFKTLRVSLAIVACHMIVGSPITS
jgi:hypothetical protein